MSVTWEVCRSSNMNLLRWPGAKSDMVTTIGKISCRHDLLMWPGVFTCHSRIFSWGHSSRQSFFNDTWWSNPNDSVLATSTHRPRLSGGFFWIFVCLPVPCYDFQGCFKAFRVRVGACSEGCSTVVEGKFIESAGMAFLWSRRIPTLSLFIGTPVAVYESPTTSRCVFMMRRLCVHSLGNSFVFCVIAH